MLLQDNVINNAILCRTALYPSVLSLRGANLAKALVSSLTACAISTLFVLGGYGSQGGDNQSIELQTDDDIMVSANSSNDTQHIALNILNPGKGEPRLRGIANEVERNGTK